MTLQRSNSAVSKETQQCDSAEHLLEELHFQKAGDSPPGISEYNLQATIFKSVAITTPTADGLETKKDTH